MDKKAKSQEKYSHRAGIVTLIILFVGFVVISRLVAIQLFDSEDLKNYSQNQGFRSEEILPDRGLILDRNGEILADNIIVYNIGARYVDLLKPELCFRYMAETFGRTTAYYRDKLKKQKSFYTLETNVSPEQIAKIRANNVCHGLKYDKIMSRFYPYHDAAGQVLGFIDDAGKGQSGIEEYYDKLLSGEKGQIVIQRDRNGNIITAQNSRKISAKAGGKVNLTLDIEYQIILEEELEKAVTENKAKSGMGVIMDPRSGEVLAMANYPLFNPNELKKSTVANRRNRVIMDQFEPGSIFKFLPVAAALERNIYTLSSRIFCEEGSWKVGKHIIHDTDEHGWLTVNEILLYSSNIGVGKIGKQLGHQPLYDYARKFGFGEATAIGLSGESSGLLSNPSTWSGVAYSQIPMGQGLAVTLMQMMSAYSSIANGGILLKPYLVSQTFDNKNKVLSSSKITPVRRAISKEVAFDLKRMLESVVDSGTAKGAYIEGYHVAGKTGTAQKVVDGKYSNQKYYASFMGFFPAEDPVLVCGIVVDEPQYGRHYGASVAVPAVKNCFTRIINTPDFNTIYPQVIKHTGTIGYKEKENEFTSLSILSRSNNKKDLVWQPVKEKKAEETKEFNPKEYDVIMPKLIGMHILNAEKKLKDFGLQVDKNSRRGRVISQYPPAGTYLKLGESCKLETKQ
ncbi:MAG: penicillin-binding transpeptidase domain-containing protein [Candidatus Neomarinimicrobiota bacterium]